MKRALSDALVIAAVSVVLLPSLRPDDPPYAGLSPPEALKTLRVAPGFRVELAAHEPLVADPVSVAWDERGRMWVAEMPDYPTGPPGGRVRWLEDADGDGIPDRGVVFADGLPWPTSVLPHEKGLLVAAAPDILYLEDTDGDERADARRVVLTGFGLGTTQLRVNSLQRGIDGRIYGANGRSGGKIRRPQDPPERAVSIDQHDFRCDPATFVPEAIAGPSQFGQAFDAWGRRFLSWNTVHIREEVLSPRDLERHPRLTRTATVAPISDHGDSARIFPLAPPPRTFNDEPTDHFNASCGLAVECGGVFPASHAGNAFVCEPLTGLVHRDILAPGPGPVLVAKRGEEGSEFLASTDPWFHPVNCRSGPDGALYVVDLYREMVEHPEYVHDDKVREKIDFARGRGHGRIYRVAPEGARLLCPEDLSRLPTSELVGRFESPNGRVRELAQRLILERREPAATALLEALARDEGRPLARARALWTLEALGRLTLDALEPAFDSREARVREAALRIARERRSLPGPPAGRVRALASDADPAVRLQAVLALGDLQGEDLDRAGGPGKLGEALARVAFEDAGDPWFEEAILSSLRGCEVPFTLALTRGASVPAADAGSPRLRLAAEACRLCDPSPEAEAPLLAHVALLLDRGRAPAALAVAGGLADALRQPGARELRGPVWERVLAAAAGFAPDPGVEKSLRLRAAALLSHAPWEIARGPIAGLLDPRVDLELELAAVRALGARDSPERIDALLGAWPSATPGLRAAVLDALARSPPGLKRLIEALDSGEVSPRDVDLSRREALLRAAAPEERIQLEAWLAKSSAAALPGESSDRAGLVDRYRREAPASGDAAKGAAAFAARCAACHRFAGTGHAVGPDLSGIGRKSRDELLASILDPNRSTVPGYTAYAVTLEDGQVLTGILAGETARAVTLRRPDGLEDGIARASIRAVVSTGTSLMPEGLEAVLTPGDVGDLLEYLRVGEGRRE